VIGDELTPCRYGFALLRFLHKIAALVTNTECESQDNAHGHGDNRLLDQREAFLVKNNGGAFYMTCQHKVQTSLRAILHREKAVS